MINKKSNSKRGFTLAEVLVTLAIIGVVAALTIPSLIQGSQNTAIVTSVKKAYATFSQAYTSFIADENTMTSVWTGDKQHVLVLNQFATKLSVIKNCGTGTGCFPDVIYKMLEGSNILNYNQSVNYAKAILADGSAIYIYDNNGACNSNLGTVTNWCGNIAIDINGVKEPNQLGKDYFVFRVLSTGVYPAGVNGEITSCEDPTLDLGFSCSARILLEGAINY